MYHISKTENRWGCVPEGICDHDVDEVETSVKHTGTCITNQALIGALHRESLMPIIWQYPQQVRVARFT